jgi:hypothetical protein
MKAKIYCLFITLTLFSTINSHLSTVQAQGTVFTYQGRLNLNGTPATGNYDFQFILFTTNQFGSPAGPILTNVNVSVSNGLFTTTLDFGGGIFNGANFWLDISVRTSGAGAFNELGPRQPITSTPYAITAANLLGVVKNNLIQAGLSSSTIGGGSNNIIQGSANSSTIAGGHDNVIVNGPAATIGGGWENTASNFWATVGGGVGNMSDGRSATVGGGENNVASGDWATVVGGYENTASGDFAVVVGGENNVASGGTSFAAGMNAWATNYSTFVWADDSDVGAPFSSTAPNEFLIRAAGGVGINMNNPNGASLYVKGNRTDGWGSSVGVFENTSGAVGSSPALRVVVDGGGAPDGALSVSDNGTGPIAEFGNGNAFVASIENDGTIKSKGVVLTSDRNAKENFNALDAQIVLAKVASIPVTEWNYKDDSANTKHIGPMAQDFHAAFALNGSDDTHISVVDESGVALAAIQGLNQKFEEQRAENVKLKQQNDLLAERLNELESMIKSIAEKK